MKTVTVLAVVLVLAGCSGVTHHGEDGVLDFQKLAREFWSIEDGGAKRREDPRFAVVEFTVEYIGDASTAGGSTGFGTSMKLELPGLLYRSFTQEMADIRRYPVALSEVSEAEAYSRLAGTSLDEVALAVTSAAAGEGAAPVRYPVDGLKALDDGEDTALFAVASEVAADAALQVRLRVGVHDGKAAIMKGSTLRVVAEEGTALLTSNLTLVAPSRVVADSEGGTVAAIDTAAFVRSIQRLFGRRDPSQAQSGRQYLGNRAEIDNVGRVRYLRPARLARVQRDQGGHMSALKA